MNKGHQSKVEVIKRMLLDRNLPVLPLNTVKSRFYIPDIITRRDSRFIPIEFVNSKTQLNFDVGGICLIYNKDIIDRCLVVIDDKLWQEYLRDFRLAKMNLPPKVDLIPFREVGGYLSQLS